MHDLLPLARAAVEPRFDITHTPCVALIGDFDWLRKLPLAAAALALCNCNGGTHRDEMGGVPDDDRDCHAKGPAVRGICHRLNRELRGHAAIFKGRRL
jgi:hypothetical protein